jgi:hypothetical protein
MRHADTLAALRKPGRTDEQIRECLEALASTLHTDDPICVALDTCIADLIGQEDCMRAVREMRADELDNARSRYQDRGEYDVHTLGVLRGAVV